MRKPFIRKAIVAVNGSQSSIHAAMYGIILARQYDIELKAVFVVDTATIKYLSNSRFIVPEDKAVFENELHKDGEKYLEYIRNLAKVKGVTIETELKSGSVCSEIVKSADAYGADLILTGGRENTSTYVEAVNGRRTVAATFRNQLIEYSHCPVVIVNKKDVESLYKIL